MNAPLPTTVPLENSLTRHSVGADLIRQLAETNLYRRYQTAFTEATGLPLSLITPSRQIVCRHGGDEEGGLRGMIGPATPETCRGEVSLPEGCAVRADTFAGPSGLVQTEVPIFVGRDLLGYLATGDVFLEVPSREAIGAIAAEIRLRGVKVTSAQMHRAIRATRVIPAGTYAAMVELLVVFAEYLGALGIRVARLRETTGSPQVERARQYLVAHQAEPLRLGDVARVARMSSCYFCKQFRRSIGMSFTAYLSSLRVERAKELLLNRQARVIEVAFATGFQSLAHFNRTFRRITGQAPTRYRAALVHATLGPAGSDGGRKVRSARLSPDRPPRSKLGQ